MNDYRQNNKVVVTSLLPQKALQLRKGGEKRHEKCVRDVYNTHPSCNYKEMTLLNAQHKFGLYVVHHIIISVKRITTRFELQLLFERLKRNDTAFLLNFRNSK